MSLNLRQTIEARQTITNYEALLALSKGGEFTPPVREYVVQLLAEYRQALERIDRMTVYITGAYWGFERWQRDPVRDGSDRRDQLESFLSGAAEEAGIEIRGSAAWPLERIRELYMEAVDKANALPEQPC